MFHPISAFCSRWLYFVSLTWPFVIFKAFGGHSLSEPCSPRPLNKIYPAQGQPLMLKTVTIKRKGFDQKDVATEDKWLYGL